MSTYDMHIHDLEDWNEMVKDDLGIIVDPIIFRIGQFFLEGGSDEANKGRWNAITSDIGALVRFFDLVVLHDKLPAFNYADTFDQGLDFGDRLGAALNESGDKTLLHINVEYAMYRAAKQSAIGQLRNRLAEGPFVPEGTAAEILHTIKAIQYEWEPSLEELETELPDSNQKQLTRFLLGQLVFAGYAQLTGSPHVLAPKRSLLLTSVGLHISQPQQEADIYRELARRVRGGGPGWRSTEVPWTPSFLPYLVKQANKYRDGPDTLLELAKTLRTKNSVQKYRRLLRDLSSGDLNRSKAAHAELAAAADAVATELDSNRQEMEGVRQFVVEVLPEALGASGGAVIGAIAAGPIGAAGGGLAGAVGAAAIKSVNSRLWGWFVDDLPFHSAHKLLARSVRAEQELRVDLIDDLHEIWQTKRRHSIA
jgi:hypothetical protein